MISEEEIRIVLKDFEVNADNLNLVLVSREKATKLSLVNSIRKYVPASDVQKDLVILNNYYQMVVCAFVGYRPNMTYPFYVGKNHGEALQSLHRDIYMYNIKSNIYPKHYGFVVRDIVYNSEKLEYEVAYRFCNREDSYKIAKNRNQLNEQIIKKGESLDSYQIKTYDIKMVDCDIITEVFNLQNIAYDVNKSFKDKQLLFNDFD